MDLGAGRAGTSLLLTPLHSSPVAATTHYRKVGGLKQQKCVLLPFWRPEVQNQVSARLTEVLGENPSLPLPASHGFCGSSAVAASFEYLPPSSHDPLFSE